MTVHALLLGVEQPDALANQSPPAKIGEARLAAAALYNYLTLTSTADPKTITQPTRGTAQSIDAWFDPRVIRAQDTAIVLYCGHGWHGAIDDDNGWWLQDGPLPFRTVEAHISRLDPATRVIVIAACCFAAPDPNVMQLLRAANAPPPSLHDRVVVLSSSETDGATTGSRARLFVHVTIANALAGRNYETLQSDYNIVATTDGRREWSVYTPPALATSAVLAPK
ncbi:MAG TPA: hypothetical protein VGM88_20190 [Kofleriaceae bacterium]|jgi:hypothetical protein